MRETRNLDELFARMANRKRHNRHWEMRLRHISMTQLKREAEVIIEVEPEWREETIIKPVIKKVAKKSVPVDKLKATFTERQMQIALAALERKNNG